MYNQNGLTSEFIEQIISLMKENSLVYSCKSRLCFQKKAKPQEPYKSELHKKERSTCYTLMVEPVEPMEVAEVAAAEVAAAEAAAAKEKRREEKRTTEQRTEQNKTEQNRTEQISAQQCRYPKHRRRHVVQQGDSTNHLVECNNRVLRRINLLEEVFAEKFSRFASFFSPRSQNQLRDVNHSGAG